MYLLSLSGEWYIKSYDLAMDIRISILDLIWDMSGRAQEKIFSNGYDDKTIYLGSGSGRIKIYNKKKESKLNMLGDLTRVEVSKELEDFDIRKIKLFNFDNDFPNIYTNNYMFSFEDYDEKNRTLLAILYAVQNGFPLKNLSRVYRSKIKNMLEGGYKIKFDNTTVTQVLRHTILTYFLHNSKVVFR